MTLNSLSRILLSAVIAGIVSPAIVGAVPQSASAANLRFVGRYDGGLGEDSNEISAFDSGSNRLFITNSEDSSIDIVDLSDPSAPSLLNRFSVTGGINSVAVNDGLLAVALAAEIETDLGSVAFYDIDGIFKKDVKVGALPDMLTFTPDGGKVLVANEGEPNDDYTIDPEGSVSIIDVATYSVKTVGFGGVPVDPDVRVFGPGATPEQDFEPEYIAVAPDGKTAYVALQENNALGLLNLDTYEFERVIGLGFKDHSLPGNELDASNEDGAINIQNWPVFGMFQPDAISAYEVDGETYIVTANEGDARDYDGFSEEARVADLLLDPTAFPNAEELQKEENLGRLKITTTLGDTDGDGDYDELYSYGGRSFSIFDAEGNLVFDSGAAFEKITAEQVPDLFNGQDNDPDEFDDRSDDKGPEPEGVTIGYLNGKPHAFIGLERVGGVMVYDISDPTNPVFKQYSPNRPEDISPEGIVFLDETQSPTGIPLLITTNEISGTTAIYEVKVPEPGMIVGLLSAGAIGLFGIKRQRQQNR